VYIIPIIPTKENGANAFNDFIRQRGNNATNVTPNNACVLDKVYGVNALINVGNVSLRIIEYARTEHDVTMKHAKAGIQLLLEDTDRSQACRYETLDVYAQIRPIKEKQYPEITPMILIKAILGTRAKFVDPNAATPAGRPNTPAPTIDLTRLNIIFGIDAPSVVVLVTGPPAPPPTEVLGVTIRDEAGDCFA
jgi:hypothetical protein